MDDPRNEAELPLTERPGNPEFTGPQMGTPSWFRLPDDIKVVAATYQFFTGRIPEKQAGSNSWSVRMLIQPT